MCAPKHLDCQVVQVSPLTYTLLWFQRQKFVSLIFADAISCHFWQSLSLCVSVVPEVEEQDQKHRAIKPNNKHEDWILVRTIIHNVDLSYMDCNHNKLDLEEKGKENKYF